MAQALLAWFRENGRAMDWRETDDPYRIWVSEIMLQQTTVRTVTPYYRRFLAEFPDLPSLAAASPDRVLKAWEGLGYYSRARNLHKAAGVLAGEHAGRLPRSVEALMALPGIGRSTAGAIAAIAFRQDAPVLDANVKRVVARLAGVREDVRRSAVEKFLWERSASLILPGAGRETALAVMDLGAGVCTPRRPDCSSCPLSGWCAAHRSGHAEVIPARAGRKALPRRDTVAGLIEDGRGRILIRRRPARGLLGGLWELPGGTREAGETLTGALERCLYEELGIHVAILAAIGVVKHAFSHFRMTLHAYRCRGNIGRVRGKEERRWVTLKELEGYAFPKAHRKLLARIGLLPEPDAPVGARR